MHKRVIVPVVPSRSQCIYARHMRSEHKNGTNHILGHMFRRGCDTLNVPLAHRKELESLEPTGPYHQHAPNSACTARNQRGDQAAHSGHVSAETMPLINE